MNQRNAIMPLLSACIMCIIVNVSAFIMCVFYLLFWMWFIAEPIRLVVAGIQQINRMARTHVEMHFVQRREDAYAHPMIWICTPRRIRINLNFTDFYFLRIEEKKCAMSALNFSMDKHIRSYDDVLEAAIAFSRNEIIFGFIIITEVHGMYHQPYGSGAAGVFLVSFF